MTRLLRLGSGMSIITAVAGVGVWGGCAAQPGPEVLSVSAGFYHAAFDAAVEAARSHRMPAVLRDRRRGVIETEAAMSASILEPWYGDGSTLWQGLENTVAAQRRRARFEFTSGAFEPGGEPGEPLTGPDVLAMGEQPTDLTEQGGELELRVWVYVERASYPGLRRSTWTRGKPSTTVIMGSEGKAMPSVFWTAVSRDRALERRLLAAVDNAVAKIDESGRE